MSFVLKDSRVIGQLFSGNIASNELHYHSLCYKSFFKVIETDVLKKGASNSIV